MAFRLRIVSPRGARGLKRAYSEAHAAGLLAGGTFWQDAVLPLHFEPSATQRYNYAKRSKKYAIRKARMGLGNSPNVYSGTLRYKMLSSAPTMKVNKSGLKMVFRGLPRYTFMTNTVEVVKGKSGERKAVVVKRPDKVSEITTMNNEDAGVIVKEFERVMQDNIQRYTGGKR